MSIESIKIEEEVASFSMYEFIRLLDKVNLVLYNGYDETFDHKQFIGEKINSTYTQDIYEV